MADRAGDVGDLIEIAERLGISDRLGVVEWAADEGLIGCGVVLPEADPRRIGVILDVIRELDYGFDLLGSRRVLVDRDTTPKMRVVNRLELVFGDDSEVVRSTLERLEQVAVLLNVGVDDAPTGQNKFIVDNVVAGKTNTRAVEGVST